MFWENTTAIYRNSEVCRLFKNTMPFQYNVSKHLATEFKFKNFQDDTNYKMKLYWFRFIELLIETLRLQSEESL